MSYRAQLMKQNDKKQALVKDNKWVMTRVRTVLMVFKVEKNVSRKIKQAEMRYLTDSLSQNQMYNVD